jgi:hypothetical protein
MRGRASIAGLAGAAADSCSRWAIKTSWHRRSGQREVPSFHPRVVCAKCGSRGNKIDVRPNWKEQPTQPSLTGKVFR